MTQSGRDFSVQRYVDGEMTADESLRFERELAVDSELAAAVAELRDLRKCFDGERTAPPPRLRPGFADRVVGAVRRDALPVVDRGASAAELVVFERWSRRIVVAAVLVAGLALLLFAGLLRSADTGQLQASPAEIQRIMEALDREIRDAAIVRGAESKPR